MERRAHVRKPLELQAVFAANDGRRGRCHIRDYCPDGLLLALEPSASPAAPAPAAADGALPTRMEIRFQVRLRGEPRRFALKARVARTAPGGVGVRLEGPDPGALRVLERLAERATPRAGLLRGLERQAAELAARLPAALLEAACAGLGAAERDGLERLRPRQSALVRALEERLRHSLRQLSEPADATPAPASAELRLVEREELENALRTADMARRLARTQGPALGAFRAGLSVLAGRPLDPERHALGPAACCEALSAVYAAEQACSATQRAWLWEAMEPVLAQALPPFYDRAAELLRTAGIDTRPPAPPPRRTPAPAAPSAPGPRTSQNPPTRPSAPEPRETAPGPRDTGSVRAGGAAARSAPPAAAGARPGLAAAFRTGRTLLDLGTPGRVPGAAEPAARRHLDDALARLQRQAAEGLTRGRADVRKALQASLESQAGPEQAARLLDDETLRLMSELLAAMLEDLDLPEPVREALEALSVPLHRAAQRESGFLEGSGHPALQLVNGLARLRGGEGAEGQAVLRDRLRALVDRVLRDYEGDDAVFAAVNDELQGLLEAQRRAFEQSVQRVVADCERRQATLLSRRRGRPAAPRAPLPEAWRQWLERARRLRVGDRVVFEPEGSEATLVFIGQDDGAFVFVDARGERSHTLTLQELAMRLRRESLLPLDAAEAPLLDRGVYRMMERIRCRLDPGAAPVPDPRPAGPPLPVAPATPLARAGALLPGAGLRLGLEPLRPREGQDAPPLFEFRLGLPEEADIPAAVWREALAAAGLCPGQSMLEAALDWLQDHARADANYLLPLPPGALAGTRLRDTLTERLMCATWRPAALCLVLDDPLVLDPLSAARQFVRDASELGCRLAIEGFGSGAFGCDRLMQLPVEYVVLAPDCARTLREAGDAEEPALLRSVNEVAHFMGKLSILREVDSPGLERRADGLGIDYTLGAPQHVRWLEHPLPLPPHA